MFPATLVRSAYDGTATGKVFGYDIAPQGLAGTDYCQESQAD